MYCLSLVDTYRICFILLAAGYSNASSVLPGTTRSGKFDPICSQPIPYPGNPELELELELHSASERMLTLFLALESPSPGYRKRRMLLIFRDRLSYLIEWERGKDMRHIYLPAV